MNGVLGICFDAEKTSLKAKMLLVESLLVNIVDKFIFDFVEIILNITVKQTPVFLFAQTSKLLHLCRSSRNTIAPGFRHYDLLCSSKENMLQKSRLVYYITF